MLVAREFLSVTNVYTCERWCHLPCVSTESRFLAVAVTET